LPSKGFPPQLGEPVVTTRKPVKDRCVTPQRIRDTVASGRSVLLIFGLGPHGLPKEVFGMSSMHLDITSKGLSLETCTALGAVVGSLLGK
jgi:hypothetical protein